MASFPYQLPRPHTTHPASDPFILVGNTPHQQAMGSIGFHHPPYLPGYHPSSTANSPESITDVPATAAADKSRRCEEEVEITREKNKNKKHRLCHNSATPIVSEESKRGKQSKRRRLREAEENPSGFVHVRARRGQATDSHSLAERVRRERISERMRMLQGLVPGCEKVTGKALVLDEIINYVQSLQHQVEFLSMRIASLSPIVYGFGLDSGNHLVEPQKMDSTVPTAVPSKQGTCHLQPPDYAEAANDYSDMPSSGPVLLQDISCYVKQDGEQGTRSAYSFQ